MSNIIIPGRKVIAVEMELRVPRPRMKGWYKIEAEKADGSGRRRLLADWFPNVITDTGMNYIGTAQAWLRAHVGTSNTAPATSQSALLGWVAASNSAQDQVASAGNLDYYGDYYAYSQQTHRFNAGVAAGVLAEVGIGPVNTNTNLFSRALILDGAGAPTTITVLGDEVLDVTYQLQNYADFADGVDGTQSAVAITGVGTRDITLRASNINSSQYWTSFAEAITVQTPSNGLLAYTGSLGAVTGTPSGTSDSTSCTMNAYSNNSLERSAYGTFGLTKGNFTHKSIVTRWNYGSYQMEFNAGIGKTSSQTLRYDYKIAWGRY
jgi:hypothetical protein